MEALIVFCVCVVVLIAIVVVCCNHKEMNKVVVDKVEDAVKTILSVEGEVCYKRWRLYKGPKQYTILNFDVDGNMQISREEVFNNEDKAVARFVSHINTKSADRKD